MAWDSVFPLALLPDSIVERVIRHSPPEDLFLLHQVARLYRDAVDQRVRRLRPWGLPDDLAVRFPRLVVLDLAHCPGPGVLLQLGPHLPQLPQLRKLLELNLTCNDLPDAEWLSALVVLTRLRFGERTNCPVEVLSAVAVHCSSLRRLEFDRLQLDWGTAHNLVAQLSATLTELDLLGPMQADLAAVQGNLPKPLLPLSAGRLQALSLKSEQTGKLCRRLAALTGLRSLELLECDLEARGLEKLNALTQLTRLLLNNTCVTCHDVAQLTKLVGVADLGLVRLCGEPLVIDNAPNRSSLSWALRGFPAITCLDIFCSRGVRQIGEALNALPLLARLVADQGELLCDETFPLRGVTQLRELRMRSSVEDASELRQLSRLTNLTCLDLRSEDGLQLRLTKTGTRSLTELRKLQRLDLSGKYQITAGVLENLWQLPRLIELNLDLSPGLGQPTALNSLTKLQFVPLTRLRLPESFMAPANLDRLPLWLKKAAIKGRRFLLRHGRHEDDLYDTEAVPP